LYILVKLSVLIALSAVPLCHQLDSYRVLGMCNVIAIIGVFLSYLCYNDQY